MSGPMDLVAYYLPLGAFLGLLPGVPSRKTKNALLDALGDAAAAGQDVAMLGGHRVTVRALAQMFHSNANGTDCVSPAGAHVLIALYKAGALPCRYRTARPCLDAEAYARSEPELQVRARRDAESAAAMARLIETPSAIEQEFFTHDLLDAVFIRHKGLGAHVMQLGGVSVEKCVRPVQDDAGRRRQFEVCFVWRDENDQVRQLCRPSKYASDRHGGRGSNWGVQD